MWEVPRKIKVVYRNSTIETLLRVVLVGSVIVDLQKRFGSLLFLSLYFLQYLLVFSLPCKEQRTRSEPGGSQ